MFARLTQWLGWGKSEPQAKAAPAAPGKTGSTQLPPQPVPKVKGGAQSMPSWMKTAKQTSSFLPKEERRLASTDLVTAYRNGDAFTTVRDFGSASPDLAAAVFAYLRVGITSKFTAVARNQDGSFNREATLLLQQIIARMDIMPNYADGFSGTWSLRSISESWAKEIMFYGACSGELVLDKTRLPAMIQPVSVTNLKFIADIGKGSLRPIQYLAGQQIDLDIPTFFYTALDQNLLQPYSASMLEPAIKGVIFSEEFMMDLQRVVKRAVHPRLSVTIDEEKFRKNIPADIAFDPDKVATYLNTVISQIEEKLAGLSPEDALVYFDSLGIDYVNNGNVSLSQEWTALSDMINAKVSTGAKTLPGILGHGSGSQNVASTESMLFVKSASSAIKEKLDEMYSRIFTLAVRLFGYDVVCYFKYADIDLRPEIELESFKGVKQARVLELLSLGFLSDEEAGLELTGSLPPDTFQPLSGTMFYKATPMGAAPGAGSGQDTATKGPSNDGSALNQNLNKTPPKGVKGKNGGKPGAENVIPLTQ